MPGSLHFNHHFGPFALARVKHNGAFRPGLPVRRTTARRVAYKTELAAAKLSPQKQSAGQSHNRQRNGLLPIHSGNITSKSIRATVFQRIPDLNRNPVLNHNHWDPCKTASDPSLRRKAGERVGRGGADFTTTNRLRPFFKSSPLLSLRATLSPLRRREGNKLIVCQR